ncbi:hypothetical protein [Actinokineospora sp.]|uniref:hypothetical protein n=1 Tax=Actinokineospora sp. TaxID=1872133 RepID=UPI003D6BA796
MNWGRSILDARRGHIRQTRDGVPRTFITSDTRVGIALCGALLVADLVARGDFAQCSACVAIAEAEERKRAQGQ